MKERINKFETFCWGAFTAVSIMGADNLFGLTLSVRVKFFLAIIIFVGWGLYLLYGKEKDDFIKES